MKGNPLAVEDEPAAPAEAAASGRRPTARRPAEAAAPGEAPRDLVNEIATLVVGRLLSERDWRPLPSGHGHARRRTE